MREPGAGIGRDIAKGERADAENDAFIERRHNQRVREEGERPEEAAWRESERLCSARRLRENTAAWYGYLMDSADSIEGTVAEIVTGKTGTGGEADGTN